MSAQLNDQFQYVWSGFSYLVPGSFGRWYVRLLWSELAVEWMDWKAFQRSVLMTFILVFIIVYLINLTKPALLLLSLLIGGQPANVSSDQYAKRLSSAATLKPVQTTDQII